MRSSKNEYERSVRKRERKLDETNRAKIFGQRLTDAINSSELSTTEIENRTFIDSTTLYNYMKGITSPKIYNVYLLAKVLKIPVQDIYPL